MGGWLKLFYDTDWTLNPSIFDYKLTICNPNYYTPHPATGWEFPDPSTFCLPPTPRVHWQYLASMNGRQFVASDIVYHYDRQYGIGDGFTTRDPNLSLPAAGAPNLIPCTSPDNFTVVFGYSMPTRANPAKHQRLRLHQRYRSAGSGPAKRQLQQLAAGGWNRTFHPDRFVSGGSATMVRIPVTGVTTSANGHQTALRR